MSTADKLNKLITTKAAIKTALENKGVTISDTDTFASYADKINSISSGGGGGYEFDFTVLGYNLEECKDANDITNAAINLGDYTQSQITEAIAYGKELYDSNYSITNTNVDKDKLLFYPKLELPYLYNDSKVLYIPNVEYSSTGSYTQGGAYTNHLLYKVGSINAVFTNSHYSSGFFDGCNSLREVGDINITGKVIKYNNFFLNCYVLRKIGNLNTTGCTNFENMFRNCSLLTSLPQLDTSSGTNFESMFYNCTSLTEVSLLDTSSGTDFSGMFLNCTADVDGLDFSNATGQYTILKPFYNYKGKRVSNIKTTKYSSESFSDNLNLESATNIDTSASTDYSLSRMFLSCSKLKEVSFASSTSNITNFNLAFGKCSSLTTISQLDTSSGTDFRNMFYQCSSLTSVPQLDTSSGTDFSNMFYQCSSLTSVPLLDTSSGTDFSNMFNNCTSLTEVSLLDTSSGTDFSHMFYQCSSLTSVPQLDTSSGTDFSGMFLQCSSLTSVPQLDTSSGTDFSYMFDNCTSLTEVSLLDTSSGTDFSGMFYQCSKLIKFRISIESLNTTINLFYFTGYSTNNILRYALLKGLGTGSSMTSAQFNYWYRWGVEDETIPESIGARQSLIDTLITYSFDRATAGYSACSINLSSGTKALLTEDEIAQITAKGYTIA